MKSRILVEIKQNRRGEIIKSHYAQVRVLCIWFYLNSKYRDDISLFRPIGWRNNLVHKSDCKIAIDNFLIRRQPSPTFVKYEVEEYPCE